MGPRSKTKPSVRLYSCRMSAREDLARIEAAFDAAARVIRSYTPGAITPVWKRPGDPVTEADREVDRVLKDLLPRAGEGWLSEESTDDPARLAARRVWVVDPVDGTRELVAGIPEWCVSIGLVEEGRAVAGGVLNVAAGERVLGAPGSGLWLNGEAARASRCTSLDGARLLASRSEMRRGEWDAVVAAGVSVRAVGSIAYKLALVAIGRADGTWTRKRKSEWDVAAGVALVEAGGGIARLPSGEAPVFNQTHPSVPGLVAAPAALFPAVSRLAASGRNG